LNSKAGLRHTYRRQKFLLSRISGDCAVLSVIVKRPAFG
jgi:hypothetical protein